MKVFESIRKLPNWVKSRYFIATIIILVFLTFFENQSLPTLFNWRLDLNRIKNQQEYYESEIKRVELELKELKGNPEMMEKFAREQYFMKKPNEEIFLIVEE